ncbi:hypothetical protein [Brevundimonas sp.]
MLQTAIMDAALPFDTPAAAAEKAWRRMCMAIDAARSVEALRWMRVYPALQALVKTEPPAPEPFQPPVLKGARPSTLEKVESVLSDSHLPLAETGAKAALRPFQPP